METSGTSETLRKQPTIHRRWPFLITSLYLASIVAVWLWQRFTADVWWSSTLFAFGPRWLIAFPLLMLIPLAVWLRSWQLSLMISMAGILIAGPITGGVLLPSAWINDDEKEGRIRVLSCNTDGTALKGAALKSLIARTSPDIAALQECSSPNADELFPKEWNVCVGPSGLRLASRFPIKNCDYIDERVIGMRGVVGRYLIEAPGGDVPFIVVHLPTPRDGFEMIVHADLAGIELIRKQTLQRERASAQVRTWIGEIGPLQMVAGDFNMPVESKIFYRHWSDLQDAFSSAGWGWGYSKQTRWFGVRIDHILAASRWKCTKCWVGPDVGSDHLPLIADFR